MQHVTSERSVKEALSEVLDPETGLSIMRMDIVHDISITGAGDVSLAFRPTSPTCPMAYALTGSIKKKLESLEGVSSVTIRVENHMEADRLENVLNSA
ncbi:metal-sulfur cluster assembly factor [Thermodesulfobacteriota bacterium]